MTPDRSDDERILRWLQMRQSTSPSHIAARHGVSRSTVIGATYRVRHADLLESREDRETVLAGYW